MSVKIQIASLDALNRLIGGDTEIEIQIRQSVVENFAKGKIKSLINDKLFTDMAKVVLFEVGNPGKYNEVLYLRPEFKDKISTIIDVEIHSHLVTLVKEKIKSNDIAKKIDEIINTQSAYIINEWTNGSILKRIDDRAQKIIKEKLGLS